MLTTCFDGGEEIKATDMSYLVAVCVARQCLKSLADSANGISKVGGVVFMRTMCINICKCHSPSLAD
jgi:hypothetical protein